VDRCALFVDADYALADGAMAVHGTRRRDSVSWDHAGLLKFLAGLARDRVGLPVLRCYWYEAAADGTRTAEHDALAEMPGLKLRLAKARPGRSEGIEPQLRRDLVTLAKSGAISEAFIASANEDLAEIVAEVQDLGLRVVILHITSDGGWTVAKSLRQECDDIVEISGVHLRPFVELIRGAEPASPEEFYQGAAFGSRGLPDRDSPMVGAMTNQGLPAAALPAPGAGYPVMGGSDYRPGVQQYGGAGFAPPDSQTAFSGGNGASQPGGQPGQPALPQQNGAVHAGPAQGGQSQHGASSFTTQNSVQQDAYLNGTARNGMPSDSHGGPSQTDTAQSASPHATSAQGGMQQGGPSQGGPSQGGAAQSGPAQGSFVPGGATQSGFPSESVRNAVQSGAVAQPPVPQGGYLHGSVPNGMQPASYQDGTGQNGAQQGVAPQAGPVQNGVAQNGPAQNGPAQNGPAQSGPAQNSAQQGGYQSQQNGMPQNGVPRNSAQQGGYTSGPPQNAPQQGGYASAPPPNGAPEDSYQNGMPRGGQNGMPPSDYQNDGGRTGARPADLYGGSYGAGSQGTAPAGFEAAPTAGPQQPYGPPEQGPFPDQAGPGHGPRGPFIASQSSSVPATAFPPQASYSAQPQAVSHLPAVRAMQAVAISLPDAVKAAHAEGFSFGESVGRDAPALWLDAVLARKPRMPSDLEARLLQGSALPIDSLLHDEVRHSLRRGFWDALENARR
jgi:hypothetical protein